MGLYDMVGLIIGSIVLCLMFNDELLIGAGRVWFTEIEIDIIIVIDWI